ncbi:hypothetical protein QUF75_17300 [Desulfococcaceae bacterium HSG7]|nr:hypothetical protein [Desulfococcaceae bacterium HSG7]
MKTKEFEVYLVTGRIPEFQLLGMLVKKRVDVIICEISLCNYHIKMNPQKFGNLDYIDKTIGAGRTFHMGFSKKYPDSKVLTKKFNAELAKFVAEGKRKAILNKYGIISW